ncbi:hypothetical protein [Embleya sp. NBC_00896]|uniref:hypothetical protein n=1 Tax=Embleya sp. NBC_00896 TaxID=2975961 RepID=UPI00386D4011|nr:hypothetical protein OG928_06135 [Embleya sp. NBC_00896]
MDSVQRTLFTVDRDWSLLPSPGPADLPAPTPEARAVLAAFVALSPVNVTSGESYVGGVAVVRTLVSWLGVDAPFRERDVRALAARVRAPSTRRVIAYLHRQRPTNPVENGSELQGDEQPVVVDAVSVYS